MENSLHRIEGCIHLSSKETDKEHLYYIVNQALAYLESGGIECEFNGKIIKEEDGS